MKFQTELYTCNYSHQQYGLGIKPIYFVGDNPHIIELQSSTCRQTVPSHSL